MTTGPRTFPRASVIIPAHDEEAVIGACLATLLGSAEPGEFDVVVACNGCRDKTADIARRWAPDVRVLDLPEASKVAALQAGDDADLAFPRLYLDADIRLDTRSARRLADALSGPTPALAAAPGMALHLADRTWPVRAFYRMWQFVPWFNEAPLGDGCFGLSAAGRARFTRWPATFADDLFVNRLFAPSERRPVPDATFVVRPPRTLRSLLKIRTRTYAANLRYAEAVRNGELPGMPADGVRLKSYLPALTVPAMWPALAVYIGVTATAKLRAHWRNMFVRTSHWDRDETARTA